MEQARSSRKEIHAVLRRRVLTLDLAPGSPVSEKELAAELGVSRTPVRECLILLADEGLVQVFPQVGTFVSRVDPQEVADAQFLREVIELGSLDDVPDVPDAAVAAELRANLERQHAADVDLEEFFELDEQFHEGLLRLGGHGSAWATVETAKGQLDRARRLGLHDAEDPTRFADQHADVLEAVLAGDRDLARSTLRTHLRTVFDDVERLRRRSPELFAGARSTPTRRSIAVWE